MLSCKHLNKFIKKYWFLFIIGIAALIVVDIVQLYQPEFLGQIVDHLSSGEEINRQFIYDICLKLLLIGAVMFGGRMLWRVTLFNASQRIEAGLRRDMFAKSERLSQNYYHETKVGSIMSWFTTDLETIEEFCGFGTVQLVDAVFLGLLVIYKMIKLDWVFALFALIPMLLIVIWGALVEKYMALKWKERQDEYDNLYDFTQENFTGIRVIKAFIKETSELHAFAKVAKKNKDTSISFVRLSVIFDVIIELIIAAIIALVLGFGSWFVYGFVNGTPIVLLGHTIKLSAGELVTFLGYFDTLVWPMIAMGQIVTMYSRARTSLKRVSAFLDVPEDVTDSADAVDIGTVRGEIELKHCTFCYPAKPGLKMLDDVSFKIEAGQTIGVVGRIGTGKSTLLALLLRLYNVENGTVFIDGHDIMSCTMRSVRNNIVLVPQDNFLFSDTVKNNIAFSRLNATDDDIVAAARFADVHDNITEFRDGYKTVMGERGVTLSGGQKQRVSLARAYLKNAPIMLLDDSVSAVDVKTEEAILANIRNLRAGKTTVVVASRVSTVQHFDRILVLTEGRVEAFDTPANLLASCATYQKMVQLQQLEREVEGSDD